MSKVHVFSSAESAFFVNSFVIETTRGLVLVDTQFLTSSARQLRDAIRAHGKPLLAVVITPPLIPITSTAQLRLHTNGRGCRSTRHSPPSMSSARPRPTSEPHGRPSNGDDYPAQTVLPNTVVMPGQAVVVDGLELHIDDLEEGESADITVIHLPKSNQLIASDLLYHRVHPWLAEGRTKQWLSQLEIVRESYATATAVFAGHGEPAGLDALEQQAEYLTRFRDWVSQGVADLTRPAPAEKRAIAETVLQRYPDYPLQMLVEMNIDGVAKELAAEFASAR